MSSNHENFYQRTVNNFLYTLGVKKPPTSATEEQLQVLRDVPVYLINLERAQTRRRFSVQQLKRFNTKPFLVAGIDGRTLDRDELIKSGIYSPSAAEEAFSRQLTLAEIGCSLSHYNIYKNIVTNGFNFALILEDDALFLKNFCSGLSAAMEELPENWGILNLNCPCKNYHAISSHLLKYDGVGSLPTSCSAYLVSQMGAQLLMKNAMPIRYPADSLVGRGLRWGVETYGTNQPLTDINNIFPTQIMIPNTKVEKLKYYAKHTLSAVIFRGK